MHYMHTPKKLRTIREKGERARKRVKFELTIVNGWKYEIGQERCVVAEERSVEARSR